MPFVRYARDRRGYETLYVMHLFEGGERSPRPRVLYACRTVPYAKVGRMTIDESVQRRIETAYPSLTFDWPRLLKEAAQSAPRPERIDPRQEQRKARGRKKEPRPEVRQVREVRKVRQVQVPEPPADLPGPAILGLESEPEPLEPITELIEWTGADEPEPVEPVEPVEPENLGEIGPLLVDRAWPVVEVAGEGRALVLRGRYIEIAHRVLSRVADPAARRRLFQEAARLNPEGWKTAEQARAGLASFEEVHSRLAEQLRRQPPV